MRNLCRLVPSFLVALNFASAQTKQPDPVIRVAPVVVEEKLLTESPATVTRFELSSLPQAELTTPKLAARAANFFESTNDARSFNDTFSLRGLTNTPIFGGPAISFYLDDLPLGSPFTFPTELTGFASAELHRGPSQNTIFGRAGSAGVVTLLTPEPEAATSGELRASFGNYGARSASANVSSAAGGQADAYVSAGWAARDGYITNTTLGRDIDDKDALSGVARFRFRPTNTAEFSLLLTALRARDGVQPLVPLGGPLFTVTRASEGETNLDAYNAALKAAFTTPIGLLSATTSLNHWDLGPYNSVLGFGFAELNNIVGQKQRNWNEEVKLSSGANSAVRWQVGAFYSDGETDGSFTRLFGPFTFEKSVFHIDSRDLAAFGEATFKFSSALSLTAGVRAEASRKEMNRQEFVPTPQVFTLSRKSSALLPKLGFSYNASRDTNFFATAGAGYKPGGYSGFTGNRALAAFGPERTKTLEAGVTQTAPDKSLAATVRLFYYDITGYQIERSFATSAIADDYLVVNAPRARSLGGELELTWKPAAGLTVAVDLGATQVTLREFRDPYTGATYSGNQAPYVPTCDLNVRIDYQHPSGWFGGVETTTNGRTYYTEAEDPMFGQQRVTLVGAHVGFTSGRFRVRAYGDNLTEEDYYSAITPGTFHGTPGAPLTFGIEASMKF
ncbi:MAG TPA: TonB-dependent receptor [Opitutaceae bacterium]|nr:TonB-dependent receptor [Opitutaceae bacterium]